MSRTLSKLVFPPPPFPESIVTLPFSFVNRWGLHRSALYYDIVDVVEQTPLILIAHGLGSDHEYHRWQIQLLTSEGYAVVAYTLPGNIATQLLTLTITSRLNQRAVTMDLFADGVRSCLKAVLTQQMLPDLVDYARIGALGHSGGAAGLVIEASKPDTALSCIVPMATPARGEIVLPPKVGIPIQLQHGTLDRLCPYEGVLAYYNALDASEKHLLTIEGANHTQYLDTRMGDLNIMHLIDNLPVIATKDVHTISGRACLEWFNAYL